ncbi:MAG: 4a-hydroxytetrahydrobiopterin dehydratase [Thiobacillus sp.]|nr:4a-hydroxytetrahydrobiopterin dehydratase [Thiobacillus sp.]
MAELPAGWEARGKPPTLFRRFSFGAYGETRAFLDALAALSEETGVHPQNINFGTTYVNVTLEAADGETLSDADTVFARRVDALIVRS